MNRIVVITGATSGIGYELKLKYKSMNDIVIDISRSAMDDNKLNFACDISDSARLQEVFKTIIENYFRIDILINCAGYGLAGATELISIDDAKKIFDVNFFGTLETCKLAIPNMPENGKIINISSACALFPLPYRTLYCASKSAVSMLSECLSLEIKHLKLNLTNICPGDIKTNFSKNRVKVFETNERYGNRIENSINRVDGREEKRMDLSYASDVIFKICQKKKFKPMYIVGKKYKLLYFLSRIFSKRLMNNTIYKIYGGKNDKRRAQKDL